MRRQSRIRRGTDTTGRPRAPHVPALTPLPSAVDGGAWTVEGSGGPLRPAFVTVGGTPRTMRVPLGDTPGEARTRLHEMAHVRWSPKSKEKVLGDIDPSLLNASEDARIHERLHEVGMAGPLAAPLFTTEDDWQVFERGIANIGQPGSRMTLGDAAGLLVASHRCPERDEYAEMLGRHGHGWIVPVVRGMVERHLGGRRPAWARTIELARELTETFGPDAPGNDPNGPTNPPQGVREMIAERERHQAKYGRDQNDDSAPWGDMAVVTPPLVKRLPARLRSRVRRASDTGAVPTRWHRLTTDGRVFTQRRKLPGGGAVLIDVSGSMSLHPDDVVTIMERYPGVIIGSYRGNGRRGELRVIARNGMRAADDALCPKLAPDNTCDGPALEWLAGQDGPRLWISDGQVNGQGRVTTGQVAECATTCVRARIERIDDVQTLLNLGGADE